MTPNDPKAGMKKENPLVRPKNNQYMRASDLSKDTRKLFWERKAIDEAMIERACYAFCVANGDDPDRMTYITDDGVQQPYGPLWLHYRYEMEQALKAALA